MADESGLELSNSATANNFADVKLPSDFPTTPKRSGMSRGKTLVALSLIVALAGSLAFVKLRSSSLEASSETNSQGTSLPYQDWLDATVTKAHGTVYEVVGKIHHDTDSFTEGLTYANGTLYESAGKFHQSTIRILDPFSGATVSQHKVIDDKFFGEGLTYANGKLYLLTYKSKTGFIFDAGDLTKPPTTFHFETETGEGWGLTYDPDANELVASDGSNYLLFWDPDKLEQVRKVPVKRQGNVATKRINELEWWRGRIVANVWFEDVLLVINPITGLVEKEYGRFVLLQYLSLTECAHRLHRPLAQEQAS